MSENSKESTGSLKAGDRVVRKNQQSVRGEVLSVRAEVTSSTGSTDEKALLVQVQWDNGTCSYFTPDALEVAGS